MPLALTLAAVISATAPFPRAQRSAWVQMVPAGSAVRALVPLGAPCPTATANGRRIRLEKRQRPKIMTPDFPDTCQAPLPVGVTSLKVAGRLLPVPHVAVTRIVVMGDTGCRITAGERQNCTTDWPFAKMVASAAAKRPDLVIHVGDYYYREICANGAKHCENWQNWELDFFNPAAPLFAAAPWVFARGNHESCSRASTGWYGFLAPTSRPLACPGAKDPAYLVELSGLTLAVVDSADLVDALPGDRKLAALTADLDGMPVPAGTDEWIVTHKPPFVHGYMNPKFDGMEGVTGETGAARVDLVLGGHLHLFGSFDFGPTRPAQLIVGDSGTRLMTLASDLERQTGTLPGSLLTDYGKIDGIEAQYTIKGRFGYLLLERATPVATVWNGTLYGEHDEVMAHCSLAGRKIACVGASDR